MMKIRYWAYHQPLRSNGFLTNELGLTCGSALPHQKSESFDKVLFHRDIFLQAQVEKRAKQQVKMRRSQ